MPPMTPGAARSTTLAATSAAKRIRTAGTDGIAVGAPRPPGHLSALPRTGFRFFAVPLRIVKGASFPVRAFAELEE